MPFPTAAGQPSYSGTFIPQLWSGKLNAKFYASSVIPSIANTNWEGDIADIGDKVTIDNIPSVTIRPYTKGQSLTYEVPESTPTVINIDQGRYFGVGINDVDEHQSKVELMDMFTNDASNQMKISIDTAILGTVYASAAAANKGATAGVQSGSFNLGATGSPLAVTASNVIDIITRASAVLTEQNVPDEDRYLVITPWMRQLMMQSNLAQAQFMGDAKSMLRNGKIGTIDYFDIYVSNLLPVVTDGTFKVTHMIAGHKSAISFASQITKVENMPNPNDFGRLVRGLNVYGYSVVKPEALVDIYAKYN